MTTKYAPQEVRQIARKIAARLGARDWRLIHYGQFGFELNCGGEYVAEWTRCEGRTDVFELTDASQPWMNSIVLDCQESQAAIA